MRGFRKAVLVIAARLIWGPDFILLLKKGDHISVTGRATPGEFPDYIAVFLGSLENHARKHLLGGRDDAKRARKRN